MQPDTNTPARHGGFKKRAAAALVPLTVLAAIAGVIIWSAWPLLRPTREVSVVQAVFDRSTESVTVGTTRHAAKNTPTVQAPGWLEAEPFFVACSALADGIVGSIEVLEGDFVERGQIVAQLIADDAELRLRRASARLAQAESMLGVAQADHEAATHAWDQPVELERAVTTSRALLDEREAELAQLPFLIAAGRATLTRLDEETRRVRSSVERGAGNDIELIIAEQQAAAQRAEVEALGARRPILEARVAQLRSEVRAAERNLELRIEDRRRLDVSAADLAAAEAAALHAEAELEEAHLELERMTIRAPISGYVQRRLKVPGDKVIRMMDSIHSAHIAHIYDPERMQVRVDVPLADASYISIGQPCEVIVEVLPDRVFRGEVLRTAHEADLQKNTLQFKVKVIDPDPVLRPEMLTRVRFLPPGTTVGTSPPARGDEKTSVMVPAEAVERNLENTRLWLVTGRRNNRGVLVSRAVRVVRGEDGWLTVVGDVQPGDLIAIGVDNPRDGEFVTIGTSATTSGGAS